ncbi:MAG: hypothetical protein K6D98_00810 [Clostridiales bacterium]|nr:hypothetical protein [Clostridiales bacterium]
MEVVQDTLLRADIGELMNFIVQFWLFGGYSIYNCILIFAQRPGAVMVATETSWNARGRYVKHEVSPIVILRPFGPVDFVYDYDDTFGKRDLFPRRLTRSNIVEAKDWWTETLKEALMQNGILYTESNFGSRKGAELAILEMPRSFEVRRKGKTDTVQTDVCITVNSMSEKGAQLESIFHELGHLFCGHLTRGKYTPKDLYFPNRTNKHLTLNQEECEAEMTKNLVCNLLGLKLEDPFAYINAYSEEDGKLPRINFGEIVKAADRILNLIPDSIKNDIKGNTMVHQMKIFDLA